MTTAESWRMRGTVMEACNCNVTCPCNFGGDPTQGQCEAILGLRIEEGNFGATRLDGLNVVLYFTTPGKVFDGNWTLGVYLDQRADQQQSEALGTILSGQAGGWFAPVSGLIGTALPAKQVPISFETIDGEHRITVPGLLDVGTEQIPNPMAPGQTLDTTVSGLCVPFYTDPAHVRRSSAFSLTDPNMSFQHPGKSSLLGQFDYTGP